jgi:hypothetical protein
VLSVVHPLKSQVTIAHGDLIASMFSPRSITSDADRCVEGESNDSGEEATVTGEYVREKR